LIRAEPQRSTHRRIETGNASSAERLDRVVEGSGPLNCPECQSLSERAITRVEAGRSRSERTVGIRSLLEYAQENVERRGAGGSYDRSPRSHAS
jgi:hypothetical protein